MTTRPQDHGNTALAVLACAAAGGEAPPRDVIDAVPPDALARATLLAHRRGHDDMATLLLAHLSRRAPDLFARTFPQTITTGDRLRALVRHLRSGAAGRTSLGSRPKAMLRDWIDRATVGDLLLAAIGTAPSLADIIRMVHPRPATPERAALYRWLIGRRTDPATLPAELQALLAFRANPAGDPPDLPLDLFLPVTQYDTPWQGLAPAQWATIARRLPVADLARRANLLHRKGAFTDPDTLARAAARLSDPAAIRAAGLGPVRLFALLRALDADAPAALQAAMQTAALAALDAAPATTGAFLLCADASMAMTRRATAARRGAITALHGHEALDLLTAALTRGNRDARLMPFTDTAFDITRPTEGPLPTRAKSLAVLRKGGSNAAIPLMALAKMRKTIDTIVLVTANTAWGGTVTDKDAMATAWQRIRAHNPRARLLCLRLRPDMPEPLPLTLPDGPDVLHLTGFSDAVLDRIRDFLAGRDETAYLTGDDATPGGMRG